LAAKTRFAISPPYPVRPANARFAGRGRGQFGPFRSARAQPSLRLHYIGVQSDFSSGGGRP
jgi:hypothetical protein